MKKSFILEEIYRQNKHWNAPEEFFAELKKIKYKRKLYRELLSYLDKRQILSIVGLRRTGKTILLKQLIKKLYKTVKPEAILFLTFDEAIIPGKITLADYLNQYLEKIAPKKGTLFIFLDEIQYNKKWQHIIKRYYDTDTRIKFIVSGSSSLFLRKKITESLAGRIYEFSLSTLSFEEYLQLKKADQKMLEAYIEVGIFFDKPIENVETAKKFFRQYGSAMETEFEKYLKYGQFPEIVGEENLALIRKYLTDAIYKKTIEYDIPKIFGVEKVDELKFLFQVLVSEIGSLVETGNIAREIGIDEKTVKKYLNYFEESFLINLVYNFTKSARKSRRLSKKVYLGSPNFFSALNTWPDSGQFNYKIGFLVENYCLLLLKEKYEYVSFWRVRNKEVDFLVTNNVLDAKKYQYIEIKYRETISVKELKFAGKMAKKSGNKLIMITKNDFKIYSNNILIPVWMLR
ncbi:MAG: ATP-binding protein [Candidatus Moraniibacteriota bacterium]